MKTRVHHENCFTEWIFPPKCMPSNFLFWFLSLFYFILFHFIYLFNYLFIYFLKFLTRIWVLMKIFLLHFPKWLISVRGAAFQKPLPIFRLQLWLIGNPSLVYNIFWINLNFMNVLGIYQWLYLCCWRPYSWYLQERFKHKILW